MRTYCCTDFAYKISVWRIATTLCFAFMSTALLKAQAIEEWFNKIQSTPPSELKVDYYVDLGKSLITESNLESAAIQTARGIQLARDLNYTEGEANLNGLLGTIHFTKRDFPVALQHYEKALSLRRKKSTPDSVATDNANIGLTQMMLGQYEDARLHLQRSYEIRTEHKLLEKAIQTRSNLGSVYYYLADFETSISCFLECAQYYEKVDKLREYSMCLNNVGAIYMEFDDLDLAESYFKKSYQLELELQNSPGIASSLGNLGNLEIERGNYESAVKYYRDLMAIDGSSEDIMLMAEVYNSMGNAFIHLGRQNEAKTALIKALEFKNKTGNDASKIATLSSLSELSFKEKAYDESIKYAEQSLKIAENLEVKKHLSDTFFRLFQAHRAKGNTKEALGYHIKFHEASEAFQNAEKHQIVAELESKYRFEQKGREIEKLRTDNEISELKLSKQELRISRLRWTLALGSGALLMLGIGTFFYIRLNQIRTENTKNQLLIKNLQTEQKVFRSQMNPHFIYNSLNSIQGIISSNENYEAEIYLSKFAKLMRGILENSIHEWVSLEKELNILRTYLELEQVRFDHCFDFEIHISDDLEEEFLLIPPMLIQPFLENSILHGFRGKKEKGLLTLQLEESSNQLIISIDDDGIGRKQAALKSKASKPNKSSLATEITQQRLQVISEQNKIACTIEIVDKTAPTGTRVVINLPLVETD